MWFPNSRPQALCYGEASVFPLQEMTFWYFHHCGPRYEAFFHQPGEILVDHLVQFLLLHPLVVLGLVPDCLTFELVVLLGKAARPAPESQLRQPAPSSSSLAGPCRWSSQPVFGAPAHAVPALSLPPSCPSQEGPLVLHGAVAVLRHPHEHVILERHHHDLSGPARRSPP